MNKALCVALVVFSGVAMAQDYSIALSHATMGISKAGLIIMESSKTKPLNSDSGLICNDEFARLSTYSSDVLTEAIGSPYTKLTQSVINYGGLLADYVSITCGKELTPEAQTDFDKTIKEIRFNLDEAIADGRGRY